MNIISNDRMTKVISVVLAVMFGVLLISLVVDAATTISGTTITLENAETISNGTNGTATTTYALCTGATGVISGDKVFVQATSSLPVSTIITAASSTATAGTINLRFHALAGAETIAA